MNTDIDIAIRIRYHRKRLKKSQVAFGNMLGLSQRAISRWERGIHPPHLGAVYNMAKTLDMSMAKFFCALPKSLRAN